MKPWLVLGLVGLGAFFLGLTVGIVGSDSATLEADLAAAQEDAEEARKDAERTQELADKWQKDLEDLSRENLDLKYGREIGQDEKVEELESQVAMLERERDRLRSQLRKARRQEAAQGSDGGGGGGARSFGDGTYRVGTDIKPGTYRAPGGDACYWARLRDFQGNLPDSIIANGGFSRNQIVTIAGTDAGFETTGCGTWTAV